MYQNCCKKCGSLDLFTEVKGNNTGLYCSDCGAWIKWISKDELRAFEYSQKKQSFIEGAIDKQNYDTPKYHNQFLKICKCLDELGVEYRDGDKYLSFEVVMERLAQKWNNCIE